MEEVLTPVESQTFEKKHLQNVFAALEGSISKATELRDAELVKNPDLRRALNIVEAFLRKKKRVCYGGMAINAHLPSQLKFYDFSKTLPDYDFFTPEADSDVKELVSMLKRDGFNDVDARLGIHKGTTKIFVDYNAVADVTFLPEWFFEILKKRAIEDDGIYYADANFLRMNMYLELSRPRGEVERWEKIYKRLLLLNLVKKPSSERCLTRKGSVNRLSKSIRKSLIDYCIQQDFIFASADLKRVYSHPGSLSAGYILNTTNPVIAYAETPEYYLPIMRQIVHDQDPSLKLQNMHWSARGDLLPEMYGLAANGRIIVLLINQEFCNAYNVVSLPEGKKLKIVALDTAITLFYMLGFVKGLEGIVPKSASCFAEALVAVSGATRDKGIVSKFPYFVTSCQGHQPSKATLLKQKAERIARLKMKQKQKQERQTRKIKKSSFAYKKTRKERR
jgi:hypothetical protein